MSRGFWGGEGRKYVQGGVAGGPGGEGLEERGPADAEFLLANSNSELTNAKVVEDSPTVTWEFGGSTAQAHVIGGGGGGGGATLSAGTQFGTDGFFRFADSNGVTFGMSDSSVITASVQTNYLTTAMQSNAATISNINLSAGTTSQNLSNIVFSNSNGVSFGLDGSTVTATVATNYLTTAALSNHSHGNPQLNLTNLSGTTASNSAGLTLSLSAAATVPETPFGISAGTQSVSTGTPVFSNSNGISFGMSGSSRITASYTVPSTAGLLSAVNASAGTTSQNLSNIVFSNSNGMSFGLSGSTITGSYTVPSTSPETPFGVSAGTQSVSTGTLVFSNSNGISFGMSGSSRVTASYTVPSTAGLLSAINASAGTTSNNLSNLVFSNGNGVSFGLNGSTVTASVAAAGGAQTGISGIVASDATYTSGTVTFSGVGGGVTVQSNTGQRIDISVAAPVAETPFGISAGTQSVSTGTPVFSNSNGISFGMSGSSRITASYTVPSTAGLLSAMNLSAGTTSNNGSAFVFSNSNGLSFGLDGSTVTASYTVPSTSPETPFGVSAGTQSVSTGTLVFSNSNGISFGMSGSSRVTASYTVPSTAGLLSAINVSGGTTSQNLSALTFSDSNGVSFGLDGSTLTASVAAQVAETPFGVSAGTQSVSTGTLVFSNSNGISFGMSGSSRVTASYTVPSTAGLLSEVNLSAGTTSNNLSAFVFSNSNGISFGLNGSTVTGSYTVPTQTNQTVGIYLTGAGTIANNSTSSTFDARSITFSAAGPLSLGINSTNGVITFQAPNPQITVSAGTVEQAMAAISFIDSNNISFGLSTGLAGATRKFTASYEFDVSAGTTNNGFDGISFQNSNGLSFGLSGSSITANAGFLSWWENVNGLRGSQTFQVTNSTSVVEPFVLPLPASASYLRMPVSINPVSTSFATTNNATGSCSILSTIFAVVYSLGTGANSRSLQYVVSGSAGLTQRWSYSAGANGSRYTVSYQVTYPKEGANTDNLSTNVAVSAGSLNISTESLSNFQGFRFLDIPFANSLSAGAYWLAYGISSTTSTAGTNALTGCNITISNYGVSQAPSAALGLMGDASNSSVGMQPGIGSFSTNAIGTTSSINIANVSTWASHLRPYFQLIRQA